MKIVKGNKIKKEEIDEENYRIMIIDEENEEILTYQLVDEETAERMSAIAENGFDDDCSCSEDDYSECERVCSQVMLMLEKAGIGCHGDHDLMLEELKDMKLVRKEKKPEIKKLKNIEKIKGKIRKVK